MATEYAAPFAGTMIATSQQFRDRNKMLGPDGIDADVTATSGAVSDGGAGASVNIQNIAALIQGSMYQLTAGPMNLAVAANGGGSNRFDIVCLTYDASHSPGIYVRIVQGTPGAGLPALTHNASGVWDFPLAHYEKTPAGAITNLVDRRRFLDPGNNGQILTNTTVAAATLFPTAAARRGQRLMYWGTREIWVYDGTNWVYTEPGTNSPPQQGFDGTTITTTSTTYVAGSPLVEATFLAPPSGKVYITVSGQSECAAPSSSQISFEVRNTNSAGSVVLAASDDRMVGMQEDKWSAGSRRHLLTGLTAKNQYYARSMHRTSNAANTATVFTRGILVEPVLP